MCKRLLFFISVLLLSTPLLAQDTDQTPTQAMDRDTFCDIWAEGVTSKHILAVLAKEDAFVRLHAIEPLQEVQQAIQDNDIDTIDLDLLFNESNNQSSNLPSEITRICIGIFEKDISLEEDALARIQETPGLDLWDADNEITILRQAHDFLQSPYRLSENVEPFTITLVTKNTAKNMSILQFEEPQDILMPAVDGGAPEEIISDLPENFGISGTVLDPNPGTFCAMLFDLPFTNPVFAINYDGSIFGASELNPDFSVGSVGAYFPATNNADGNTFVFLYQDGAAYFFVDGFDMTPYAEDGTSLLGAIPNIEMGSTIQFLAAPSEGSTEAGVCSVNNLTVYEVTAPPQSSE